MVMLFLLYLLCPFDTVWVKLVLALTSSVSFFILRYFSLSLSFFQLPLLNSFYHLFFFSFVSHLYSLLLHPPFPPYFSCTLYFFIYFSCTPIFPTSVISFFLLLYPYCFFLGGGVFLLVLQLPFFSHTPPPRFLFSLTPCLFCFLFFTFPAPPLFSSLVPSFFFFSFSLASFTISLYLDSPLLLFLSSFAPFNFFSIRLLPPFLCHL